MIVAAIIFYHQLQHAYNNLKINHAYATFKPAVATPATPTKGFRPKPKPPPLPPNFRLRRTIVAEMIAMKRSIIMASMSPDAPLC